MEISLVLFIYLYLYFLSYLAPKKSEGALSRSGTFPLNQGWFDKTWSTLKKLLEIIHDLILYECLEPRKKKNKKNTANVLKIY